MLRIPSLSDGQKEPSGGEEGGRACQGTLVWAWTVLLGQTADDLCKLPWSLKTCWGYPETEPCCRNGISGGAF